MKTCAPPAMNSRYRHRLASQCIVVAAVVAGVLTAESHAAVLHGTVINQNTRTYLERAIVKVEGTAFQALTDTDGSFRISGLPAGTYTVVANYTGLDPSTQTVVVTDEQPAAVDFALTSEETYVLDEFVVTSAAEGNAYAIHQQRTAESVRSVVSIDAFLDQTTGNPGEFLKSVQGIQMDYSQNEPQSIRVRGFDPTLTTVTMDGNEIASAASTGTDRVLQIDQLSIAAISNVEVFKAPIPSQSANSIGGVVNFNTKSAFDLKGRRAFLQLGVNMDSHEFFNFSETPGPGHGEKDEVRVYPVGRFEYANSFFENRLGIVFSIGRDHTNQLGSSVTHDLNVAPLPGGTLPAPPTPYTTENVVARRGSMSFAPNRQLRTRDDISLNTDLKVSEKLSLFLKTTLSDYHSTNRNHGFNLNPGTTYAAGSTLETYTTTNGTANQSVSVFDKYTQSWQINPGLKFEAGHWKIDLVGGFSKSTNHYENPDNFTALSITTGAGLGWTMTTPEDDEVPTSIVQNSGIDVYSLNSYRPNQGNLASTNGEHRTNHTGMVSNNVRDSYEVRYSGRFDVQRDLETSFPFYVKGGLSYNETIREKRQPQQRFYFLGDDGNPNTADDNSAAGANLARFAEPSNVGMNISGWSLREPTYFDTNALWRYWQANPQVLVENEAYAAEQEIVGRRKVIETVTGAYLMANFTLDRLNVLTGLRVEKTDIEATGVRTLPTSGPTSVLPPGVDPNSLAGVMAKYQWLTTESDYTSSPFPYLHLKYEWLPGLQIRASYSEAIGRPNFAQVLPSMTQSDTDVGGYDGTITVTRVGLEPQRSRNLDFSVEYYTKAAGEWTATWFSRDVEDYISSVTEPMTEEILAELNLGPEYSNYRVATSQNLGDAKWSGYELGFRQQLRGWDFVPKALAGVELFANFTHIYEMEGTFTGGANGPPITHLNNVVPKLFNAGISYRTPGGKFFVNLITNKQFVRPTDNLEAVNATQQRNPQQETYQFWNLEVSYRLSERVSLICTGRNMTEERPQFSQIDIIRNTQQDTGIAWMFSTRIEL